MRKSAAVTGLRKFLYLIFLLLAVLILLEVLLRWTGTYLLYSEVNGGYFLIEYDRSYENGHRFAHKSDQPIIYSNGEFEFSCMANELGYRDRPIHTILSQGASKKLVLFVGDSFIEGVGADCFQSMPHQFERLHHADSLVVLNAGISGSDVFYEYKLLENDLPRLRPDLILLGLNHTDIYEYVTRGGFERFLPDGRVKHRQSPVNLSRYRQSHLYRWYIHGICRKARYTFLSKKELAAQEKLAESEITRACNESTPWQMPFTLNWWFSYILRPPIYTVGNQNLCWSAFMVTA